MSNENLSWLADFVSEFTSSWPPTTAELDNIFDRLQGQLDAHGEFSLHGVKGNCQVREGSPLELLLWLLETPLEPQSLPLAQATYKQAHREISSRLGRPYSRKTKGDVESRWRVNGLEIYLEHGLCTVVLSILGPRATENYDLDL